MKPFTTAQGSGVFTDFHANFVAPKQSGGTHHLPHVDEQGSP
jgi:hypothetical protein